MAISVLIGHASTVTQRLLVGCELGTSTAAPPYPWLYFALLVLDCGRGHWVPVCHAGGRLLPFLCQGYCHCLYLAVQTDLKIAVMTMRLFNHFEL